MLAAARAYRDAVRWIRSSRTTPRVTIALRFFATSTVAGLLVLAVIGLVAPARFGAPGARPFASGWPSFALGAVILVSLAALALRHRDLARVVGSVTARPEEPAFEGAAGNLAACPAALQTRFLIAWVWLPAAGAVLGVAFAFASVYFVIDAILARFEIGSGQAALLGINAGISLLIFGVAAPRLATWPLATSVYGEVRGGYD